VELYLYSPNTHSWRGAQFKKAQAPSFYQGVSEEVVFATTPTATELVMFRYAAGFTQWAEGQTLKWAFEG
jgi:hypothetical protein